MTALAARLAARIAASGPMSLAEWMEACLMDPAHGYYATREPFGAAGDFVTAPEISQVFGELLGVALASAWVAQGRPANAVLAELGPGRGTLMADARRAAARAAGWTPPVVLLEASARLRAAQAALLGPVTHLGSIDDLPGKPLFLLANEFFDALPIRQFERRPEGWAERLVGCAGGEFRLGLGPPVPLPWADPVGTVREERPGAAAMMARVAARIAAHGGAAIVIDYGAWEGRGDTLQAVRAHRPVPVLEAPGAADLTAHVDFAPLAAAARGAGAAISAMTTQRAMLAALGIGARAEALARAAPAHGPAIRAAVHRLTDPAEMGDLFKALAVWPRDAPPPPGFATASEEACN